MTQKLSRRDFLKIASLLSASAALSACAPELPDLSADPIPPIDIDPTLPTQVDLENLLFKLTPDLGPIEPGKVVLIRLDPATSSVLNRHPGLAGANGSILPGGDQLFFPVMQDIETNQFAIADIAVEPEVLETLPANTIEVNGLRSQLFIELMADPQVGISLTGGDITQTVTLNVGGQEYRLGPNSSHPDIKIKMVQRRTASGAQMIAVGFSPDGTPLFVTDKIGKGHLPMQLRDPKSHFNLRHSIELMFAQKYLIPMSQDQLTLFKDVPEFSRQYFPQILNGERILFGTLEISPVTLFSKPRYDLALLEINDTSTGKLTHVIVTQSSDGGIVFNYGWPPEIIDPALGFGDLGASELQAYKFIFEQSQNAEARGIPFSIKFLGEPKSLTSAQDFRLFVNEIITSKYGPEARNLYDYLKLRGGSKLLSASLDIADTLRIGLIWGILEHTPEDQLWDAVSQAFGIQVSEIVGNPQSGSSEFILEDALAKDKDNSITFVYQNYLGAQYSTRLKIPHAYIVEKPRLDMGELANEISPIVSLADNVPNGWSVVNEQLLNGETIREVVTEENINIPISDYHGEEMSTLLFANLCDQFVLGNISVTDIPAGMNISHQTYSVDGRNDQRFHVFTFVQKVMTDDGEKHKVFSHFYEDNRVVA